MDIFDSIRKKFSKNHYIGRIPVQFIIRGNLFIMQSATGLEHVWVLSEFEMFDSIAEKHGWMIITMCSDMILWGRSGKESGRYLLTTAYGIYKAELLY